MDDLKGRLRESLRLRLSLWLSLVILGVALIAGIVSFLLAFNEANELQDDILRQTASLFDRRHLPVPGASVATQGPESDPEARLIVQRLPMAAAANATASWPGFPSGLVDGMQTVTVQGEDYRVFVETLGAGGRIAVGQQTALRNETAQDAALRALLPFLVLVPMLLLVVANLVRKMFTPVLALAAEVDQRGEQDLQPVSAATLPREIRPFVVAINRLLRRVAESMAMQQRFIAAAAHELRSPLTALSLQAERLAGAELPGAARQRLAVLRRGIERNRTLLDQLLAYARAQVSNSAPTAVLSLQAVFRQVLEELIPLAEAKRLDIGVDTESDARVRVNEVDLTAAVKNLVGNAIQYTPAGGRIDLGLTESADAVVVEVEDSGPGIPESERERVLEPFYRSLGTDVVGSGLGLSIVKAIVERFGGRLVLTDAVRSPTGLRVLLFIRKRPDICIC